MTKMTHQNPDGSLKMVDVGKKSATERRARAEGYVILKKAYEAVRGDKLKKGSALECARIAGIMAAKETSRLIPLCHPIFLTHIQIDFEFLEDRLRIISIVETFSQTGVEMEAMMAVQMACLTVYDMAKALEKSMEITDIRLLEKMGGKSGNWSFS
jgi:cyclic pyranopterin phosphate synthase